MCTRRGSLVHRYLRTNVDKLIKICINYISNEDANYTMKFMQIIKNFIEFKLIVQTIYI